MSNCIACGNPQTRPYHNPGNQPLAALNLPRTQEQAKRILRYPMDFHACLRCGHIFNVAFDVARVPYEDDSNLMYNSGSGWNDHLNRVVDIINEGDDAEGRTIIDIGAGDGRLLQMLKQKTRSAGNEAHCVAFEPGTESQSCRDIGLETREDYFIPDRDMELYKPDILVCRHVMEHLENPREFVSDIARVACQLSQTPTLLVEVPCIEKALRQGRVGDFLYEHVSNFTERSLCMLMESCGWYTMSTKLAYNGEVVIWIGEPVTCGYREPPCNIDPEALAGILGFLVESRESIVFWGGTGKSAAFLNACNAKSNYRVVDSDRRKAGRFVPGTGQLIEPAENLHKYPAKTVFITTRWRAADIYAEIKRDYPLVEEILIVDGQTVREYTEEDYVEEA